MVDENGSWDACKMYVLRELQRMNGLLEEMQRDITGISNSMTALKTKMGFIGAVAGVIVSAVVSIFIKVAVH